jgi:multidrug efflux pump subunit AcrB
MTELTVRFPEGTGYDIDYDTTPLIEESIGEVFNAPRDAVILVAIVVLIFLQNWRSTLIPLAAVPVAIVGTIAVIAALGFSVNNLTLFGLVLAIGIVVDGAIVVVEAVEHHVEGGMPPYDATVRAMSEVFGPVIAVGLVLSAVFVTCAFITGITGQFFRQFASTITVSTVISAFNSLTLSSALTTLLLKPRSESEALPKVAFLLIGPWLGDVLPRGSGDASHPRRRRLCRHVWHFSDADLLLEDPRSEGLVGGRGDGPQRARKRYVPHLAQVRLWQKLKALNYFMARSEFFRKSMNNAPIPAVPANNPMAHSQGWSPAVSVIGTTIVADADAIQSSPMVNMAKTLHVGITPSFEGATNHNH